MTILQLLNGEKVNCLQVNVLKKIDSNHYIVADKTGMAIMITDEQADKFIEIEKGLKMVKPSKVGDNIISPHPKFNPMKTKATQIVVDYDKIDELSEMKMPKQPVKKD